METIVVMDQSIVSRMKGVFARTWPLVLGEGVLLVVVGLLLITAPVRSALFLFQVLGAYWLLGGAVRVITALMGRKSQPRWGMRLAGGLIYLGLGALILAFPLYAATMGALTLVFSLGALSITAGVLSTAWGISVLRVVPGGWLAITGGLLGVLFGIMFFATPFFILPAFLIFMGVFAVLGGVGEILLAIRMRDFSFSPPNRVEAGTHEREEAIVHR
ncbi:MAG: HdeD family acid-resistance protein [Deltaproteobacteria bacterium]